MKPAGKRTYLLPQGIFSSGFFGWLSLISQPDKPLENFCHMIKKKVLTIVLALLFFLLPAALKAQQNKTLANDSLTLTLHEVDSLSQYIPVIYSNKGCGRCVTAARFFDEKSIPYLKLDLAVSLNSQVMYQLASRAAGKPNIAILYPVVAYKGVVYYGEYPLNEFLEKFAASFPEGIEQ